MLTNRQLEVLREKLEGLQNPLFLYDNDADGFCSYILLRRWLGRGKGVAVRSHPDIDLRYLHKAQELNCDAIIVLDRPLLGNSFVEEAEKLQLPLIWIDHHDVNSPHYAHAHVQLFNPTQQSDKNKKSSEPTSYLCYELTGRAEDMWIALMGCIADHFLPDFAKNFGEKYPEFWASKKLIHGPFDAYYGTELGKLAQAVGVGLKDSISNVLYLQHL